MVPLGTGASARGTITVINPPGGALFSAGTQRLLEAFAGQAAVALELADRRRDTERLALLEDRDRIAKDLHDTVIQRLFATAMTLMAAIKITQKREVATRVQRAVDDLDDTIRQIRSTIFALQAPPDEESLRSRVHALVDAAAERLGFAPSVRLAGLLDTAVDDPVGEHLLAVVQESLSNVARHARASRPSSSSTSATTSRCGSRTTASASPRAGGAAACATCASAPRTTAVPSAPAPGPAAARSWSGASRSRTTPESGGQPRGAGRGRRRPGRRAAGRRRSR